MHEIKKIFLPALMALCLLLAGCGSAESEETGNDRTAGTDTETAAASGAGGESTAQTEFSAEDVPAYSGEAYVAVNGNVPFFTEEDLTTTSFESYSDLDALGRCGTAYACVGQDLMPTKERGDIHEIHPTGWHGTTYDFIDGGNLYNRCHLIAHKLTGEDANEKNLITGTRYLNNVGMTDFEDMVCDYVKETGNHVLYRVTPVFSGDNLLADGVLMEAESVEDGGRDVLYCVYVYNVQPGVIIDYATGDSQLDEETYAEDDENTYILNTGSMKFHLPSCDGVQDISESNRQEYTGSRQLLIDQGYSPCGSCNP